MDISQAQSPKYLGILAVAACLILGLGWLLRPGEIQTAPAPLPSESELAQLARRAERRSLDSMTQYFAETADQADNSLVSLPEIGASGVAWNDGIIVTEPLLRHDAGTLNVQWPLGETRGELTVWGPGVPLAAVTARGLSGLGPARPAASLPQPGSWVLAVWRAGADRRFAAGTYLQSAAVMCGLMPVQELMSSLALSRAMSGGGLFDADGGLLGVILPCGGRFAAVAAASVDAILKESSTDEQQVLARFGLVFATLGREDLEHFKAGRGVLVREVWTGHRGDEAGIRPGDVVTDLNDTPVMTARDLTALLARLREEPITLAVRRGPSTHAVVLSGAGPEPAPDAPDAGTGVEWQSSAPGFLIESVSPGSRAAKAGLRPGDRLLRIDSVEPRSLARVKQILASGTGPRVLLEVERADRRLALFW